MSLVAIQTPHYAHNYGAQLQAYALGQAIVNLGYDIEYINRRPAYFFEFSSFFDKFLKRLQLATEGKGFLWFENKFLQPQSVRLIHNSEYNNLDTTRYHAVVVGSDQIWRDDYFKYSFDYSPYLFFINDSNIKKISYAASFGKNTCCPPEDRRLRIANLLTDFKAISVREKSGVDILKQVYNADGLWVADPTLLHEADFYVEKFGLNNQNNHRLVTYILGQNSDCVNKINLIAQNLSIKVDNIYKVPRYKFVNKYPFNRYRKYKPVPSVLDWLNKIKNADYVITDSFHGMVFCIIFKKKFLVINNTLGGSDRFTSLLGRLDLTHKLCEWNDDITYLVRNIRTEIDYDNVYRSLCDFRTLSLEFLRDSLQ